MQAFTWIVPEPLSDADLSGFGEMPRPVAKTLVRRGFADEDAARRFLEPAGTMMRAPALLMGMDAAAQRVAEAVSSKEPIKVYGDYDADGVTATALMTLALRAAGADVTHYIPNRFDEGYGLNRDAIQAISDSGTRLLVTVDCGVRSMEEVAQAVALGMDVVITDHHHPGPELPPALAIVNPNQPEDDYPFGGLSGVGLAYKLVKALEGLMPEIDADTYLDLVAVGTVADVSPLVDENRWLVSRGLAQMRQTPRQGLAALIQTARLNQQGLLAENIAFGLGPRINAAGRLDSAETALALLMADDPGDAERLSAALDSLNRKRQSLTRSMVEAARGIGPWLADDSPIIFAIDPSFNEGVVGLAASRLADEYHRPALVARQSEGLIKGSARSIPGFHITQALEACSDCLVRFGGHAAAAGFVLKEEELGRLLERLGDVVQEMGIPDAERRPLAIDAEVGATELDMALLDDLDLFEPTGEGNPRPVFLTRGLQVARKQTVGANAAHLKLMLASDQRSHEAIAFRQGGWLGQLPPSVDVAYHFERNEYRGYVSPQMNVLDIRPAQAD